MKYDKLFEKIVADGPKGVTVPAERAAAVTRVDPADREAFRFALMSLADRLEKDLEATDQAATVVVAGDTVRVLTDSEASAHAKEGFDKGLRRARKNHRRAERVNPFALSEAERRTHERRLYAMSFILKAVDRAKANVRLDPVRPTRPRPE